MACNLRRSLVFGLLLLAACGPPESTCSERDIKSWTPATFEGSTPVYCDSKLVGYQLDIDAQTKPEPRKRLARPGLASLALFASAGLAMAANV